MEYDKVLLVNKQYGPRGFNDFVKSVNKLNRQGYSISESESVSECANFTPNNFRVVMIKPKDSSTAVTEDEYNPTKYVSVQQEHLESNFNKDVAEDIRIVQMRDFSKKAELLEFAKLHNIEVPEDKKLVTQIKSFLTKEFEAKG